VKKHITKSDLLLDLIRKSKLFLELLELLDSEKKQIKIKQLHGSSKSLLYAAIHKEINSPILLITNDHASATNRYEDLKYFVSDELLSILSEETRKYSDLVSSNNLSTLIDGLSKAQNKQQSFLVSTTEILAMSMPKPRTIDEHRIIIKRGATINFLEFTKKFLLNGFQKEIFVSEPGEIAIRGGIIDIYPIAQRNPIRIEFWGDEVESIREFEPLSQRSIRELGEVGIIDNLFDISQEQNNSNLSEYLRNDTILIIEEPQLIADYSLLDPYISSFKTIMINSIGQSDLLINTEPQSQFKSSIINLRTELKRLEKENFKVVITSDGDIHSNRLKDLVENIFTPEDTDRQTEIEDTFFLSNIIWSNFSLTNGFLVPSIKLAYFTEHEIFARMKIRQTSKSHKSQGLTLKEIKQLQIGDFVVHEDKGIGKFDGFQTIEIAGNKQDCMRIIFSEGDLLFVHLNYIHKVQKYAAQDGVVPKLSKLGSADWLRRKSKAKKRLKDIARELIKLYAERKKSKGYAYPSDDVWQKEFEASFLYEDTPDQARTTEEVKKDMQTAIPMDRLVCGDVGFGKTEIAIRAAFKAANNGKQTALLVPTTILAQQHFLTFQDRLSRYPVTIEVLSRFRSKKEQEGIINLVKEGKIDILIGTHRLLSKDISFKNLGLLVIDEEHRFGVGSKEKLRQMRAEVDTLTLTATPIPRTLNFSLMGARDLSIIETPPRNRLSVETEIVPFDYKLFVQFIEREIKRGGQVFFVNDKITNLEKIAYDISMLISNIRFGVAHGQMSGSQLEKVMEKFIEKKFDVLFATKIVESGIDIPNANTMIINNAQNFGLAELYQLRGRVGRADIQAYCYLSVPHIHSLSRTALQRLQAIEEFTDLGSGLRLAMRDMEIRGAGNLLGAEQSGFIIDMGFDLFQKILDEAVSELKTDEFSDIFEDAADFSASYLKNSDELQIEVGADAYFPDNYMENSTDRFSYYKRLYNVSNNRELDDLAAEIQDRYGKMPDTAKELFYVVRLRLASINTGFSKIVLRNGRLVVEFPPQDNDKFYTNIFNPLIEYLNTIENINLKEIKKRLYLEIKVNSKDDALEHLFKIKRTINLAVEDLQ